MKPIKLIKSIKPIHIIFLVVSILLIVFLIIGFANNWDFSSKHKSNTQQNTQPQLKNEMASNNLKSSSVQNNDETTNALINAMDVLITEIDDLKSKCK